MADSVNVQHKLQMLFETKLDDKSKQLVGKQIKGMLENAVISFDEAEARNNLKSLIAMMNKLFDKAEMEGFDVEKLLNMPSQQALQEIAKRTTEDFQKAFDQALKKSGGIKIDFGTADMSAMTEPLNQLAKDLTRISDKIANSTEKSVSEIEESISRLGTDKNIDKAAQKIEKMLSTKTRVPKDLTSAISQLSDLRNAQIKSSMDNDPWEVQYQHLLKYVKAYEVAQQKFGDSLIANNPQLKDLYEILSPKAKTAKISLENFVNIARGNELVEDKNKPWAREKTLQEVKQVLKNGITVNGRVDGDTGDGNAQSGPQPEEPPKPEPKPQQKKKVTVASSLDKFVREYDARLDELGDASIEEYIKLRNEMVSKLSEAFKLKNTAKNNDLLEHFELYELNGNDKGLKEYLKEQIEAPIAETTKSVEKTTKKTADKTSLVPDKKSVDNDKKPSGTVAIDENSLKNVLKDITYKVKVEGEESKDAPEDSQIVQTLGEISQKIDAISKEETLQAIKGAAESKSTSNHTSPDDEVVPSKELTEQEKLVEQYNQNKQKTLELLRKEQLSYEEILYLVKEIQTEYASAFYKDKNYDLGDDSMGLMTSAYNKLRRGDMIDPRLDKAINGVGMTAEEGARILTDFQNRQAGIMEDVSKKIQDIEDDDAESIEKENGALEDKLERLQELSDAWGQKISQAKRDRYEALNQKEMDSGLTSKEEDRMSELYEEIESADASLEEFGETYDKIILKLANGKKVDILPDDSGLGKLFKVGDEYGESYNGVEIEDIIFERVKKETVARQDNVETIKEEASAMDMLIEKAAQYASVQEFERENIKELKAVGVKSRKESSEIWKQGKLLSFSPIELTKEDAIAILREKVPDNILEGWFRSADSGYKPKIEQLALSDNDIRNAALNIMWDNYKESTGKKIGFEDFLHSDIPMYRGKNSEKYVEGDETIAFTFDPKVAEKFGKYVLETIIKPIDTLGSYQTTGESEALVYRKSLEGRPEYNQWHDAMANKAEPQMVKPIVDALKEGLSNQEAPSNEGEPDASMEALKGVLSGITYNVNVVKDDDTNKVAIDTEALKGVLNSITYNVKVLNDDTKPLNIQDIESQAFALYKKEHPLVENMNGISDMVGTEAVNYALRVLGVSLDQLASEVDKNLVKAWGTLAPDAHHYMTSADNISPAALAGAILDTYKSLNLGESKIYPLARAKEINKSGVYSTQSISQDQVAIDEMALENVLSRITYNVKVVHDADAPDSEKAALIDAEALKATLNAITYNVKIAHDDTDKAANKIALDDSTLKTTLQDVFKNILNPLTPQNDGNVQEPWAREETLGAVKGVLENIQANTAKIGTAEVQQTVSIDANSVSTITSDLTAIKTAVEAVNSKITGKISGVAKSETANSAGASTTKKKHKDGTISHGQAQGESGSMQKVLDYYYWLEEQLEQHKSNVMYAKALNEAIEKLTPRIIEFYKNLIESGEEDPAWLAPLNEKHNLHMSKIRGEQSLKEEDKTVKELLGLYEELGRAEARRDMTSSNIAEQAIADDEAIAVNKLIEAKLKLIDVNEELGNKFADSWFKGVEQETKNPIKDLGKQYEELGRLRAKIDTIPNGKYSEELQKQLETQEKLVAVASRQLELSLEQRESFDIRADEAYYAERTKIAEKAAKEEEAINKKIRADAIKEQLKDQEKALKKKIKQNEEDARMSKANSTVGKAIDSITNINLLDLPKETKKSVTKDLYDKLEDFNKLRTRIRNGDDSITKDDIVAFKRLQVEINHTSKELNELAAIHNLIEDGSAIAIQNNTSFNPQNIESYRKALENAIQTHHHGRVIIGDFDYKTKQLNYTVDDGNHEVTEYKATWDALGRTFMAIPGKTKKVESVLQRIVKKAQEFGAYFTGSSLIYKGWNAILKGINYVREIDSALTELKKVTDETEESYERFLDTASKTANKVGSTIKEIISSTSDWARLGYSMEEAATLAESTSVLLNVSEFQSIEEATSALTSTLQAFSYTAEQSMGVVDILNEVGNNFAVSSDGLATALKDSASSLVAANNSYEEAVALIAAANRVVQDPSSVGAALRTISLRLRSTSTEQLEEAGEDTTGVITSKSKLQSKVKGLTGVDILTDTGSYRSTYDILLDISKVWKDISDVNQAALLEIIAGKTRSNTAAAILSNGKDLEEALLAAQEAEGSALKENEEYLDSIQGKIDHFNNAVQTMWNNLLGSDFVKDVVSWGTQIMRSLDTTQGKILAIVKAVALLMVYKKVNPLTWLTQLSQNIKADGVLATLKNMGASLLGIQTATKAVTAETIANTVATQTNNVAEQQAVLQKMGLAGATGTLNAATKETIANNIAKLVTDKAMTVQIGQQTAAMLGYTLSVDAAGKATVVLDATTKSFMASNPVGWILGIVSAVVILTTVITNLVDTTEDVAEAAKAALSEYQNAQEKLTSHKQTIEEISDDYEKLSKGVNAFGENVNLTTEEYERYNEITNQIAEMFPQMVSGYTEEGNAILTLKGNVEELTKAYEAEAQAARDAIITSQNEVFENFKNNTTEEGFFSQHSRMDVLNFFEDLVAGKSVTETKIGKDKPGTAIIDGLLEDAGILSTNWFTGYFGYEAFDEEIKKHLPEIQAYYRKLKAEIDAEAAGVRTILNSYLEQDFDYAKLSQNAKNAAKSIISGFDTEFYSQFDTAQEMESWVVTNIIKPLQDTNTSTQLDTAFNFQTKFNNGEVSIKEYEQEIQNIIELIDALDLDKEDEIIKSLRLIFDVDENGNTNIAVQNVAKDLLADQYDGMVGELTKEDLDIIDKYKDEWKVAYGTLYSWDELKAKIEDAKQAVEETSITDSLSKISSLEEAYNSLGDAIKEFKEEGTASSGALEGLQEIFGDTDGFEDLYKVLATGEGDVETAITNVANAYIGQKGILSDLSEDERQIMIERLKALGVINAEKIVRGKEAAQEELNTTYQQYSLDLSAYATAEEAKLAIAAQAGLDFSKINDDNLEDLAKHYGVDLTNYATLAEKKIAIAREMAKETAELERNQKLSMLRKEYVVRSGGTESAEYKQKVKEITDAYDSAINAIPSDDVFGNIQSIVDDYYNQDFSFDFSNGKIGIGRDFDDYWGDDPQTKAKDAWDALVSKYENKLALITNERDLIEAEIDKAEALGRQASTKYYDDLIRSSTEEKNLLIEKKAALEAYLNANKDNVDQDTWTEMNNEIHETALAIKECTINLLEYYDALEEIDSHYFEQTMDDVSRLGEEIEFVQGLLEDEDVADENGNWTAEGVTMLGLYTNEMERAASSAEMYKQKINDVAGSWTDYQELLANATDVNQDGIIDVEDIPTEKLDKLYDTYGYVITSEEEYKEKTDELTDSMRSEIEAYNDAKDGIVEMNEARIDAIKDGVEKEIEAYEDYIDTVKEALDAERDLYDFKKNVKKQTKDIASLERRIAALSGSTNASDIALRRKLEAELYEAKESLSDTYYDHAKDQQQSALDEEAEAFSKSKEKYIEELEKQLEDTETLITNSIMDVLLNADTILAELTGPGGISETYGDILSDQLKQPWIDAADQAATWKKGLEEKMTGSGEYAALIGEGGTITAFANGIATKMEGPWSSAQTAASGYFDFLTAEELGTNFENTITGFGTQISNLVTYWDNVKKAAEAAHAEQERKVTVGGNPNIDSDNGNKGGNGSKDGGSDLTYNANVATLQSLLNEVFGEKLSVDGKYGPSTTAAVKKMQTKIGATSDGKYGETTSRKLESYLKKMAQIAYDNDHFEDADIYKKHYRNVPSAVYAKGTMGTTKDQWALTDEIGDELVLVPGPNGNLSFMRKGTSVVPADITANLVEWGKLNPDMLNIANPTTGINMISNAVNKPEFNISFDALVKAENITEETLPAVRKLVTQELNRFTRELNYALKGKGAR